MGEAQHDSVGAPSGPSASSRRTIPEAYAGYAQRIFALFATPAAVTTAADVAEAVWRAAHDTTDALQFPAGADALALAASTRRQAPLGQ